MSSSSPTDASLTWIVIVNTEWERLQQKYGPVVQTWFSTLIIFISEKSLPAALI